MWLLEFFYFRQSSQSLFTSKVPTIARTGLKPKPGARNGIQVSPVSGRKPITWAVTSAYTLVGVRSQSQSSDPDPPMWDTAQLSGQTHTSIKFSKIYTYLTHIIFLLVSNNPDPQNPSNNKCCFRRLCVGVISHTTINLLSFWSRG